jgi:hypothetical protein
MSVRTWVAAFLTLSIASVPASAKDLELRTKAGDFEVVMRIDKDPPVLGVNRVEVEVRNGAGERVTTAKLLINFYMPPMPRMVPMNYRTEAKLKGRTYRATMKIIMAGPWIVAVKINLDGKTTTAKFHIDAR